MMPTWQPSWPSTKPRVGPLARSLLKPMAWPVPGLKAWLRCGLVIILVLSPSRVSRCQEDYEETQVLHGDVAFHRFQQRLALYPQQLGRFWQHPTAPLQVTSSLSLPETGDNCPHCQTPRRCQAQVWPRVLSELQAAEGRVWDPSLLDFLAFGCYVCTNLACEQALTKRESDAAVTCREQLFVVQDSLASGIAPAAGAAATATTEPQTLKIGGALVGSEQGVTVDDDEDDD